MASRRSLLLAAATLALAGCSRRSRMQAVPAGATVLALGDSLTFGTGASPDSSYPTVLARLTGWNVVNAGIPGDTSAGALARLPGLLQEHAPALVIVGIGGNDFLRRLPVQDTRANVRATCEQARASGAQVLLVAIPELNVMAAVARSLGDHPLYAEIAEELKLPVHGGGWSGVLSDPALRSDAVHANARGYELFADGLAKTARELGLAAKS
ncbi:arylesterase [Ramlibacter sp. USB13]|uniref:Arylesterase n=1 Tax=Ramlibacter cellulosilyticus TaxID=2764187 RepID=A0A923SCJ6_9BURK|nr:GDSL-type esterase/lipase family protein [Ramlibacter cellulosilyticus]MBC5785036.1 arylesterase [Ramlibacter cellulosilyticus]